jgi:hypothetical protein
MDLAMKRFLGTWILRSEFREIIAPFSNAANESLTQELLS